MSTTIVECLCLYAPQSYWIRWYIESIWRTIFLAEGVWKVHIFRHLFLCFQTSVYTLGEFPKNRNNSTVFEELSVSIVDLMVANIRFTGSVSRLLFLRYRINWEIYLLHMHILLECCYI